MRSLIAGTWNASLERLKAPAHAEWGVITQSRSSPRTWMWSRQAYQVTVSISPRAQQVAVSTPSRTHDDHGVATCMLFNYIEWFLTRLTLQWRATCGDMREKGSTINFVMIQSSVGHTPHYCSMKIVPTRSLIRYCIKCPRRSSTSTINIDTRKPKTCN